MLNNVKFQGYIKCAKSLIKTSNVKKIWLLLFTLVFVYIMFVGKEQQWVKDEIVEEILDIRKYDGTWRNLTEGEINKLSVLGRILYLEEERPQQKENQYLILFWKYGQYLKNRHFNYFTKETYDPLNSCSVKNCKFTFNDTDLKTADAVIFHLHRTKGLQDLPKDHENPNQIWAFLTDESPYHTFMKSKVKISDFDKKFNWSMTYRMDSDIPVPYGRARKFSEKVPMIKSKKYVEKRKDRLVTILGSNCGGKNHRWQYVKKMNESIHVDVYGGCGNKTACPGHFKSDCPAIDSYLFYLSFENSDCREYITEKVFWNAYHKESIPVIMGYDKKTYEKLLPPLSYLHVDDFASPKDLADYILFLNRTEEYKKYFQWKEDFEIVNEHGYFKTKSYHLCRICEALNFNKKIQKYMTNSKISGANPKIVKVEHKY
ncbi:hypothetical protein HHI36_014575 [Cryptolaemus montrouzieri]|uniref:Fucosyltransferase n=1 Tax=Cryptolaemus montrouzieri TaxID=559131 RepID=A0ABD2N340_9CUCU